MAVATARPISTRSAANGVLLDPYRVGAGCCLKAFPMLKFKLEHAPTHNYETHTEARNKQGRAIEVLNNS